MKKHLMLFSLLLTTNSLLSFEEKPWFNQVYEMRFDFSYDYSYFHKINNSDPSYNKRFNQQLQRINLGICPTEYWDIQTEIEVAETTYQGGYFRSGAIMARKLWMDDVVGDMLSVATGFSARGVPDKSLGDISTPYASNFNAELNMSAGKEWSHNKRWLARFWGFFALGFCNEGSPWTRLNFDLDTNISDSHYFSIFTNMYFGFGSQSIGNVEHFHGWGKINHKSIDLGAKYEIKIGVWGKLGFSYVRRAAARNYPSDVNSFIVSYHLPFSPF